MYDTERALEESVNAVLKEEPTNPQFIDRFKKFYFSCFSTM